MDRRAGMLRVRVGRAGYKTLAGWRFYDVVHVHILQPTLTLRPSPFVTFAEHVHFGMDDASSTSRRRSFRLTGKPRFFSKRPGPET